MPSNTATKVITGYLAVIGIEHIEVTH